MVPTRTNAVRGPGIRISRSPRRAATAISSPAPGRKGWSTAPEASKRVAPGERRRRPGRFSGHTRAGRGTSSASCRGNPPPRRRKSPISRGVPVFASTPRKRRYKHIYWTHTRGVRQLRRAPSLPVLADPPAPVRPAGGLPRPPPRRKRRGGGPPPAPARERPGEAAVPGRGGTPGEAAGDGRGRRPGGPSAAVAGVPVGRARLPTGRISSFSRSAPRVIHALSRSTEARNAPGSTSSFSRNAFGSFIPVAQRIARLPERVEDTIVPTRTKFVRVAWAPVFASAEGSRDASFIPSPGAKRLFHCSGGTPRTLSPAGGGGRLRRDLRGVRAQAEVGRRGHAERDGRNDDGNAHHGQVDRLLQCIPRGTGCKQSYWT